MARKLHLSLTCLKRHFQWGATVEEAFEKLKHAMTTAPVLALPNFTKNFIVKFDGSGVGIGGVLMQEERPIASFSQSLRGKNLVLSTYEKEKLASVQAAHWWRHYLLG